MERYTHYWYKGYYIERAYNGMYVTRGDHSYLKADTLKGLYQLIDEDIADEEFFTNHD